MRVRDDLVQAVVEAAKLYAELSRKFYDFTFMVIESRNELCRSVDALAALDGGEAGEETR